MKHSKAKQSRGMAEKDETPAYEARNHPVNFLRQAVRDAEKKSSKRHTGKRAAKKRG